MSLAQVGFVLRRVAHNLRELFWTHVLACGIVAMTLFVFGSFILCEINLEHLLKGWGEQIQLVAYLDKNLDPGALKDLLKRVETFPEVERVRHISQEQAWRDFQTALGAQSGLLEGLPRDVLPASLDISLKPAQRDSPVVEKLAERLKKEKAITIVEYPQEWVERLGLLVLAVEWTKWIFGGALFLATFFIVGSTIKLAMLAIHRRLKIEKLQAKMLLQIHDELIFETPADSTEALGALEPGDQHGRGKRPLPTRPLHDDAHAVADAQPLQPCAQLGPGVDWHAVDRDQPVPAVQTRPAPDARGIRDHEADAAVAGLIAEHAQIALGLTVVRGGRPAHARAQSHETQVAVVIEDAGATHIRVEEWSDIAPARLLDGALDCLPVEPLAGASEQPSHHVIHRAPSARRVANYEVEHRPQYLTVEMRARRVIPERARFRVVRHPTD